MMSRPARRLTYAQALHSSMVLNLMRLTGHVCTVQILLQCMATIGSVGNKEHKNRKLGKAGISRHLGASSGPCVAGTPCCRQLNRRHCGMRRSQAARAWSGDEPCGPPPWWRRGTHIWRATVLLALGHPHQGLSHPEQEQILVQVHHATAGTINGNGGATWTNNLFLGQDIDITFKLIQKFFSLEQTFTIQLTVSIFVSD